MQVVVQISDPHFGTEQPRVQEALLAWVREQAPVLAVWSGDITQRARRHQFDAARRFADALNVPHLLAIAGNHDIPLYDLPQRLWRPYAGFRRAFGAELEPSLTLPGLCVLGVNTTRPWRHKHGEVSAGQVARVALALRQAPPGSLRIVVVHQPVWVVEEIDRRNLLRGHAAALQAWGDAGADIVMGGHIHLPYVRELLISGPAGVRPMWIAQAGTALSHRVRGGIPNSVNLVRFDPAGHAAGSIERWDFNASSRQFERISSTAMTPP